jgi:hypothetical protein
MAQLELKVCETSNSYLSISITCFNEKKFHRYTLSYRIYQRLV